MSEELKKEAYKVLQDAMKPYWLVYTDTFDKVLEVHLEAVAKDFTESVERVLTDPR